MSLAPVRADHGLLRDSLVYTGGLALQRGLALLVLPAATRILGPDAFGVAGAALAVAGLLSMVFSLGLNYALVRLYRDEPEQAERAEWAMLLRVQLLGGAVLGLVAWIAGPWWSRMYDDVPWGGALQAAVILAFAQAAMSTTLAVLRAARRVWAFAAVVAVQVAIGAPAALVLADRNGPGGLVAGLALGAGAGALAGSILTFRRAAWSGSAVRAGLALALPFVLHMMAAWVLSLSDRVLVERFLGLEDLAAYHVAYAVGAVPMLVTDAVQAAWLPRFYALDEATKRVLPGRLIRPVTRAVAATAIGVVAVAPWFGRAVAPSSYSFPEAVVALVVAATVVRVIYILAFGVVSDRKESGPIARASGAGAALNVALNLVLIPTLGLVGAAAATLAAYTLMSVLLARRAALLGSGGVSTASLAAVWGITLAALAVVTAVPTGIGGGVVRVGVLVGAVTVGARAMLDVRVGQVSARRGPVPRSS